MSDWQDGVPFGLDDDTRALRHAAREFAESEVLPLASEIDRNHRYPRELVEKMASLGFMGATVPVELGGAGLTQVAYCLMIEELAAACASTAIIVSAHHSLCTWPVMAFGTPEQHRDYVGPLARGEKLGCFALSEPGCGSDAASLTTTVTRDGEGFVINGTKNWITNGTVADIAVLFATHDRGAGHKGVCAFVHPLTLPGITRGKAEDKLGIRGSPTCSLTYDNVKLGKEHLLSEFGKGFKVGMATLNGGRTGVAAQAVGIGRAALRDALAYSKQRITFGKRICEHQSIQNYLAEMLVRLNSARWLTLSAAALKDQGADHAQAAAMAKLAASEAATFIANKGVQIHGGYGYVVDYPAERHLRDAKITEIYEGTSEIQRMVVASHLVKDSE